MIIRKVTLNPFGGISNQIVKDKLIGGKPDGETTIKGRKDFLATKL